MFVGLNVIGKRIPWPTLIYPERLGPPGLRPRWRPRWRPIARRLNIHHLLLSTILLPWLLKPWARCVLLAWPFYHPWERTSVQCPVTHVRPPTFFSGYSSHDPEVQCGGIPRYIQHIRSWR